MAVADSICDSVASAAFAKLHAASYAWLVSKFVVGFVVEFVVGFVAGSFFLRDRGGRGLRGLLRGRGLRFVGGMCGMCGVSCVSCVSCGPWCCTSFASDSEAGNCVPGNSADSIASADPIDLVASSAEPSRLEANFMSPADFMTPALVQSAAGARRRRFLPFPTVTMPLVPCTPPSLLLQFASGVSPGALLIAGAL